MAVIDDIDQKCDGLLEIKDDNNVIRQFDNWMNAKNLSLSPKDYNSMPQSNLVRNILETVDVGEKQFASKDICFDRSTHDKDGGYDKDTFDRVCFGKA